METIAVDSQAVTLRIDRSELLLLNNALNEVSNGVDIPEWEFPVRLGEPRAIALRLLDEIGDAVKASEGS